MHTRTAVLAAVALVATGLPLALAAPVGTPDGDLETRAPSAMGVAGVGAFDARDDIHALESRGRNTFLGRSTRTTPPELPFTLSPEESVSLRQFMMFNREDSVFRIRNVTFTIRGGIQPSPNSVIVSTDPDHSYTTEAIIKLTNEPAKQSTSKTDLGLRGLDALQGRDEIIATLQSRTLFKPPSSGKPRKNVKNSTPSLPTLTSEEKAQLQVFLNPPVEGSSITIHSVTFTIEGGDVAISTDLLNVYPVKYVLPLSGRGAGSARDLGVESFTAFQARDEIPDPLILAKKPPVKSSRPIKTTKPSVSISLSADDKAQLKTFLNNALNGSITIGGVTFTYQDGVVTISSDQDSQYDVSAVIQLTQ